MKNKPVYILLLILGLYLVVSLTRSAFFLLEKGNEIGLAQKKVEEAISENKKLNDELNNVQSKEYIEKQAREKLNMSKKGETVVVIPQDLLVQMSSASATTSSLFFQHRDILPNWKRWWGLFL